MSRTPADGRVRVLEETELRTDDGVRLAADLYRPAGTPRGTVVLAHGFSGTRRGIAVVEQAASLTRAGFVVLTYDARGHGASSGDSTMGRDEVHDLAAAVAHLRRLDPAPITVGASMGAQSVLEYAVTDPRLCGIVLVSAATSWWSVLTPRGLGVTAVLRTAVGRALARRVFGVRIDPRWQASGPATELIGGVGLPVAIVHGLDDPMVRPRAAAELYEAARPPRRLELVRGMGHAFTRGGIAAIDRAVVWVATQ